MQDTQVPPTFYFYSSTRLPQSTYRRLGYSLSIYAIPRHFLISLISCWLSTNSLTFSFGIRCFAAMHTGTGGYWGRSVSILVIFPYAFLILGRQRIDFCNLFLSLCKRKYTNHQKEASKHRFWRIWVFFGFFLLLRIFTSFSLLSRFASSSPILRVPYWVLSVCVQVLPTTPCSVPTTPQTISSALLHICSHCFRALVSFNIDRTHQSK